MGNQCAPLLLADVIARAERLNVPLPLDRLKATKIEIPDSGCMAMEIIPVECGMKAVGTAVTVRMDNGDNFPVHVASCSVKEDGYVMVIDGKRYVGRAYSGDLIMGACQTAGFKGVVTDGCTRNRDDSMKFELPVYSRGFMPRGPTKKDRGNINTPIMCGSVRVGSGDLMVGDSDGMCVAPKEHIETVPSEAEKKLAYKENREKTIAIYREVKAEGRGLPWLTSQQVLNMLQAE